MINLFKNIQITITNKFSILTFIDQIDKPNLDLLELIYNKFSIDIITILKLFTIL